MARSKVAVLRTAPRTVLEDYHRLMNLAGYQQVLDRSADTALRSMRGIPTAKSLV